VDGTVGNEDGTVKRMVETAKKRTIPRTMIILRGGIRLVLGRVKPNSVWCTGMTQQLRSSPRLSQGVS